MNLLSEIRSRFAAAIYSLPLWVKITVPYLVGLITLFGILTWLVSQTFSRSLQEQFRAQLVDEYVTANDSVFQLETDQLSALRAISRTSGVPAALAAADTTALDTLIRPLSVNSKLSLVQVLDDEGKVLYSLRQAPEGFVTDDEAEFESWPVVQRVLAGESDNIGDKFVGVIEAPWGAALYTAGPVKDGETVLGVVLVGTPLLEVVAEMKGNSLANITLYTPEGQAAATTTEDAFELPSVTTEIIDAVKAGGVGRLQNRIFTFNASEYSEALGALTLRTQPSGWLVGVSLPRSLMTDNQLGAIDVSVWIGIGMAAVVLLALMGIAVARLIAAPIDEVTEAMEVVTRGNFEVEVNEYGEDETGQLAQQFNRMTRELRLREPGTPLPPPPSPLTLSVPLPVMDGSDDLSEGLPSAQSLVVNGKAELVNSSTPPLNDGASLTPVNGEAPIEESVQDEAEGEIIVAASYEEAVTPESSVSAPVVPVEQGAHLEPVTVKTVTVLCADIINASSVFADSDPGITSYFLKEYDRIFQELADERGGAITQFGPERSLIVFGLPEAVAPDTAARNAMRAAIILWEEVAVINAQRATRNQPALELRVTVHTAEAQVDIADDPDAAPEAVTGEAIQTVEAMQAHAHRTDDHILISEPTVMALADRDEFAVEACATFGEDSMALYTIFTQRPQFDLE